MVNRLLASTALLATTAAAASVGSATVVNKCAYDIVVNNVPASGGGYSAIGPNTLSTGGSYSQVYTELSNSDGWSIKLTKGSSLANVMQFEYTFHNDGIIWFDMSDVNGDPFESDWEFTATGDCTPKQTAYQYSTDDAYGMQSCPSSSSVTVTLCAAGGTSDGGASSAASAYSSPSETASTPAAYTPTSSTTAAVALTSALLGDKAAQGTTSVSLAKSLTTLDTSVVKAAHTVTNKHTTIVTEYITMSPVPAAKRHEHQHRHAAHHEH